MKNAKQTECQVEESTRRYVNIFLVNLAQICPEFYAYVIHDCAVYIHNSLGRSTGVQGCSVVPLPVYTTLLKLLNPFELSKHSTKST